ncbi:MAG: reverse transcriptase domain-containing protein, partial [Candidatus Rokuibacteriota bacterium]
EPLFIHDSFACRQGKGTLAASDRLMEFLCRVTANGRRGAWALTLDVASFFPSIHKETLHEILARRIRHPELVWLTRTLLFHDPTTNYRFRSLERSAPGPGSSRYPVPAAKSLFGKQNARGLPIGNLTSQFWGNVYLNELDHFVKRRLGCRHYVRYVDDMILVSTDRDELVSWRGAIETFLRERLRLELRPEPRAPFPVGRGVEFVGWKTWWNRRLPRRRTLGTLQSRLDAFQRRAVRSAYGGRALRIDLGRAEVERLRSIVASYSGHLRHGQAVRGWEGAWSRHPWLGAVFARRGWQVEERWPARRIARAPRFQSQYWQLVRRAGERCLVFCQVGRFVEFRGPQRALAERVLGLRRARIPRAGYAFVAGFPVERSAQYASRALGQGLAVVVVRERRSTTAAGCRVRAPAEVLVPGIDAGSRHRASEGPLRPRGPRSPDRDVEDLIQVTPEPPAC